jgi:hypothetical protein
MKRMRRNLFNVLTALSLLLGESETGTQLFF